MAPLTLLGTYAEPPRHDEAHKTQKDWKIAFQKLTNIPDLVVSDQLAFDDPRVPALWKLALIECVRALTHELIEHYGKPDDMDFQDACITILDRVIERAHRDWNAAEVADDG